MSWHHTPGGLRVRLFQDDIYWTQVNDGNEMVFQIFSGHYSFRKWRRRNGKNGKRMVGPGESIVLLGKDNKAIFIWRRQLYSKDGQTGVNCMVFRNLHTKEEQQQNKRFQSSTLLLEAEEIAVRRWPGERLFTYVNPKKVKSANPGYCYKMAGWTLCGESKAQRLLILQKII